VTFFAKKNTIYQPDTGISLYDSILVKLLDLNMAD